MTCKRHEYRTLNMQWDPQDASLRTHPRIRNPQYAASSMGTQYLVLGNSKRIIYLLHLIELMQVSMTVRAVWGIWLASPKTLSTSLNPCYGGNRLGHHRLLDLSPSLCLARTQHLNVNILGWVKLDVILLPLAGVALGKNSSKSKKRRHYSHSSSLLQEQPEPWSQA